MKGNFLILLIALVLFSCSNDNNSIIGKKTSIEVEEIMDMGTVARGETINAKIAIKNTGDVPLIITDVKGSCTCTVTEKPKDPVQPGETVYSVAKIETSGMPAGTIKKAVTIFGNTKPASKQVVIKAKIIS